MAITIVSPTATEGFVTKPDLNDLDDRLSALSDRIDLLEYQVDQLRGSSSPVEWDMILGKPLASLEAAGLIRLDSMYDSVSESTGASLWVVKKLLTQIRDLVMETRKVNNKSLKTDIVLDYRDVGSMSKSDFDAKTSNLNLNGYVLKTTTINGKPLTGNITLTYEDIGGASWSEYERLLDSYFKPFVTWDMTINGVRIKDMPTGRQVYDNHLNYVVAERSPKDEDYTYNGLVYFPNTITARVANTVKTPAGHYDNSSPYRVEAAVWDYDPEVVNRLIIRKHWTINGIPINRDNGGINFKESEIPGFCSLDKFTAAFDRRVAAKPPLSNLTFKDRKEIPITSIASIPKGYVVVKVKYEKGYPEPSNIVEIGIPYCVLADGTEVPMEMID